MNHALLDQRFFEIGIRSGQSQPPGSPFAKTGRKVTADRAGDGEVIRCEFAALGIDGDDFMTDADSERAITQRDRSGPDIVTTHIPESSGAGDAAACQKQRFRDLQSAGKFLSETNVFRQFDRGSIINRGLSGC